MTTSFESIEVSTSVIRSAYEPARTQLQELLPESYEHTKTIHEHRMKAYQAHGQNYEKLKKEYNDYLDKLRCYDNERKSLWNKITGKRLTPPEHVPSPGLPEYIIYTWLYGRNPVPLLLAECKDTLLACEYADKIKMTHEQLKRVEYFKSGEALKSALEWLGTKQDEF